MSFRWLSVVLLAVFLAGGCATTATVPEPADPRPLSPVELEQMARLLELQDEEQLDSVVLREAARSGHPQIRAQAALAVGRIGDVEGAGIAADLLEDSDTAVAATAAFSLGLIRDPAALPRLSSLLHSDTLLRKPTVAAEAAAALGQIGTDAAVAPLVELLNTARTDDPRISRPIGEALLGSWRAGTIPVAAFERWLDAEDENVRWRAAYGLNRANEPGAVPTLVRLARDEEPVVRSNAVRGLTESLVQASGAEASAEVLPIILELVSDESYSVRIEAIRALGSFRTAESVAALQEVLGSGDAHERFTVLEALPRLGDGARPLIPALVRLAASANEPDHLRALALSTLVQLDPGSLEPILPTLTSDPAWRVRAAVVEALRARRADAVPDLEALVRDTDPRVATAALEASVILLGPAGMEQIRPLLLEMVRSPFAGVRIYALQGLAWLADPATFPLLLDAYQQSLADEEPDAGVAAVDAIADLGLDGAVRPERAFFARFRSPPNRDVHRRALARFGDAALAAWGELPPAPPDSPHADYRSIARSWLADPGDAGTGPRVLIDTSVGEIEIVLLAEAAPLTVANFLDLVNTRFYDGLEWARLVPNFMIQGGDPQGDTTGGPGYSIRDEQNRIRFDEGILGMALSGPDTAGSQFFVTYSPQPHLDGDFTAFGRVLSGNDVLRRLMPGDRIISIRETVDLAEE